ncbi:MAG TPA: hypothetical protein VGE18_01555 [Candidatus Paceibacterota bacterium]
MEHLPGAEQKINEYVERIQNGEDKEFVLQGLGPAFRTPVEERLAQFEQPTPFVEETLPQETIAAPDSPEIEQRKREDQEKIDALKKELGIEIPQVETIESEPVQEMRAESVRETIEAPLTPEEILRRKTLGGWVASYELARIAVQKGIDLSTLSREEYADFAIEQYLAIDDTQLRVQPWQRTAQSVDEVLAGMRERRGSISEETERAFARFSHEMMQLAEKPQQERYISERVRVLSGTKDSNSWLFFSINEGTDDKTPETYKSYLSLKDLNAFRPEQLKAFMVALQAEGYNGGVKIFQDLTEQGSKLNDQIVMHGYSEKDAALALEVAAKIFGENIEDTSVGKDEYVNGVSKSYSQIMAEKIKSAIQEK